MQSNNILSRSDLWSLEEYAECRDAFRTQVMAHKKHRQIRLGDHATLYFEDAMTMKYQIQEMLRVEKLFSAAEIEEELAAYNPLIPSGTNWKATFMIEYADAEERSVALHSMPGIEHKVWVTVDGGVKIYAIANEDLERSTDEKAAAVHFMRFELDPEAVLAAKQGATVHMGIDHEVLPYAVEVSTINAQNLAADLA